MRKNKFFSLLTAAVLTVTGFCQNALLTASAEPKFYGAEIPEGAALAYSENSFGDMIARSINRENMRITMNSVVHSVEMNGTEATVGYESTVAGRAVVCVYEDVGADKVPRLLGTGIQNFDAELNTVTVPVQMTALPEYYLVRVYLIGDNDSPLSAEYTDPMHTREMQMLLQSDINDYTEDYKVLNLDESSDTNFAVYNEDVMVLTSSDTENVVLSQDNEKRVFVIKNYTGPIGTGAIVSVECGSGTAAIFKIESVETDGDITTIQGDSSMKTEDAFLYMKMETDTENNTVTYTPPEEDEDTEGFEFKSTIDEKPAQGRPAAAAMTTAAADSEEESEEEAETYQNSKHFTVEFGKGLEGDDKTTSANLHCVVDFQLDYQVEIYKAVGWDKINFELSSIIDVGVEASIQLDKKKIPVGSVLVLNPVSHVGIGIGPFVEFTIEGKIAIGTEFSLSYGSEQGLHADAVVKDISLQAEAFIGAGFGGYFDVMGIGGELSVSAGVQTAFNPNSSHEGCTLCSDIALSFVAKLTATLDIGFVDAGFEPSYELPLGQFYLSDTMGFGVGKCPNLNGRPSNPDDPDNPEDNPDDPSQPAGILPDEAKDLFWFRLDEIDGETVAYLESNEPAYSTTEYEEAKANVTEIRVPENYLGKYKVVGIGDECFASFYNLETVVLPDSIQSIGHEAFLECAALTNVVLPDSIEFIGVYAFFKCAALTTVVLPDSIESIGDYAFCNCTKLTNVNLPKNLTSMGIYAFQNCNLSEIIIPRSLSDIPNYAFNGSRNATNVVIPEGVKTIGDHAFSGVGADKGTKIKIPRSVESVGEYAMSGTTVMSPIYVRDIGGNAFAGCDFYDPETKSSTLVLSSFIRKIGADAFNGTRAKKVVFPKYCTAELGTDLFGDFFLSGFAPAVTEVVLPDNMTRIPDFMFIGCNELEKVHWPSGQFEVGDYAFYGCSKLSLESLPRTLRKVGSYSFVNCWNPEQDRVLKLPDGLKEIGPFAFTDCFDNVTPGLVVEIHIPETVEKIYLSSFAAVTRGTMSVYFWNPNTEILDDSDEFENTYPSLLAQKKITIIGYARSTAWTLADNRLYGRFILIGSLSNGSGQTDNPQTSTDPPQSITFTDLQPNTIYNFYNLLGDEFTAENLLYLSQGMSDSNGTLTIYYLPKSDDTNADKFVRPAQGTTTTTEQPAVSEIKGDTNGDFSVDISDVVLAARFLAEDPTAPIKRQGITNLDVNGDGKPTPEDNIMILRFIAKLIPSLD